MNEDKIVRINELFDIKMDCFLNEDEKFRLLFLFSRFEGKFGSKTLGEFLSKPSYENVDNSRAGISTVNGEMMAFLKYELEKELAPSFISEAKSIMSTIARGCERQIQSVRGKLDWNLYLDNSEEIDRVYNMIGGYTQFYNKLDYKEFWNQVYAGPLTMEFDYKVLKERREEMNYSQSAVAEAVGTILRTYQKWEYGETQPNCYFLLRLMNW